MDSSPLANDADRIAFSEAADALEQGQAPTIPEPLLQRYLDLGLMARDVQGVLRLTHEGRRQHHIAKGERFTDG